MNSINLIGVDIAKDVMQLYGVDEKGGLVVRKRLNRTIEKNGAILT